MFLAQFHRSYWHEESESGIGKIHFPNLGIIAFVFDSGTPEIDTNFMNEDEVSYYSRKFKKSNRPLRIGVQIDRDVEPIVVDVAEDIFSFSEIDLEVRVENNLRYFRAISSNGEWKLMKNAPIIEYQRCDSLICVR